MKRRGVNLRARSKILSQAYLLLSLNNMKLKLIMPSGARQRRRN